MLDYLNLLKIVRAKSKKVSFGPVFDSSSLMLLLGNFCNCSSSVSAFSKTLKPLLIDLESTRPCSRLFGVDSSTVAADRHLGLDFSTIQTTTVCLCYGQESSFQKFTEVEIVDGAEKDLEARAALEELKACVKVKGPAIVFFDGSLIYLLKNKDKAASASIFDQLQSLSQETILVAYTSLPASREVCLALLGHGCLKEEFKESLRTLSDSQLFDAIYSPAQIFEIGVQEFGQCKIFNYYLKTEQKSGPSEICKLEICISSSGGVEQEFQSLIKIALKTALDQLYKGQGYVRALELAHNLAIIGNSEKFALIECVVKMGKNLKFSQKVQKKLRI